jgi:hypothetical protein
MLSAEISLAAVVPISYSHFVPADLRVGDRFHLLFATRETRNADSAEIADFNAFVNTVADSANIGPTTAEINWFVVASSPNVHARDNAFVEAPVYNLQGELLAAGFADMWDGALATAIKYDEHASAIVSRHHVWTGSRSDGTTYSTRELGQFPSVGIGDLTVADGRWLEASNSHLLVEWHMYALSEPLIVVPEPTTLAIAGVALCRLFAFRRSRYLR